MRAIVLASASSSRRKMLEEAGVRAIAVASGVDEEAVREPDPVALAVALARAKAAAVGARFPEAWVIGADSVAHLDGEAFGKPTSAEEHRARLRRLRGRTHALVTAWCVVGPEGEAYGHASSPVTVRADVTDDEIDAYVAHGDGGGCAGGYTAEGQGAFLFERIDGDWFNVVGLPLYQVLGELRRRGWRFGA